MPTQVDAQKSVTLDGNGAGQVALGPPAGTRWALDLANVSVVAAGTGAAPSAASTCKLYRGSSNGPVQQVDVAQFTGNGAASQKVRGVPYFPGQVLWAVWSGGDAGAIATLQVYGQVVGRSDPFESAPPGEGFPSIPPQLIAGDPNGEHIFIGSPVPADLVAYYTGAFGATVVFNEWIGFYRNATHYWYIVTGRNSTTGQDFIGRGYNNNGTVHPFDDNLIKTAGGVEQTDISADMVNLNGDTALTINDVSGAPVTIGNLANPAPLSTSGIPHGNGVVKGVRITTTGALVSGVSGETDVTNFQITADVVAGRTYRIGFQPGLITGTVATDQFIVRIRRDTAVTGTQLAVEVGAAPWTGAYEQIWQPSVTGSVPLFLSIARNSGTGTYTVTGSFGGGQARGYLYVEDVSDTANWGTG